MIEFENKPDWAFTNPYDKNKHPNSYYIQEAYEYLYIYENVLAQCKHSLFYELQEWIHKSMKIKDNSIFTMLVASALGTKQIWNDSYIGHMHHRPSLLLLRRDWISRFGLQELPLAKKPSQFEYNSIHDFEFELENYLIITNEADSIESVHIQVPEEYPRWGIQPRKIILDTNECDSFQDIENMKPLVLKRCMSFP